MPPLGSQPRVIEVQPADERADVESGSYWIQPPTCARYQASVWHLSFVDNGSENAWAVCILQCQHATSQCVHHAESSCRDRFITRLKVRHDVFSKLFDDGIHGLQSIVVKLVGGHDLFRFRLQLCSVKGFHGIECEFLLVFNGSLSMDKRSQQSNGRFGPLLICTLIGVAGSCALPGISVRSMAVEIMYYCSPVALGMVVGLVIDLFRKPLRK